MYALEITHAALREAGVLLDVRPTPRNPWLEVVSAGETRRIGRLDFSARHGAYAMADAAIQQVVAAGLFVPEHATTFSFIYHFDSVEAWLEYMADRWRFAPLSAEVIAQARATMRLGTSELRIERTVAAARLRRR